MATAIQWHGTSTRCWPVSARTRRELREEASRVKRALTAATPHEVADEAACGRRGSRARPRWTTRPRPSPRLVASENASGRRGSRARTIFADGPGGRELVLETGASGGSRAPKGASMRRSAGPRTGPGQATRCRSRREVAGKSGANVGVQVDERGRSREHDRIHSQASQERGTRATLRPDGMWEGGRING